MMSSGLVAIQSPVGLGANVRWTVLLTGLHLREGGPWIDFYCNWSQWEGNVKLWSKPIYEGKVR